MDIEKYATQTEIQEVRDIIKLRFSSFIDSIKKQSNMSVNQLNELKDLTCMLFNNTKYTTLIEDGEELIKKIKNEIGENDATYIYKDFEDSIKELKKLIPINNNANNKWWSD